MQALVAGQVDYVCGDVLTTAPQLQAGTIKAYALAAPARSPVLPDVPTTREAGLPEFEASGWFGLFAPKATPKPVVDKLADAAHKAMHLPAAVETLRKQGYEPLDAGPDAFSAFIGSEITRWSAVARAATRS